MLVQDNENFPTLPGENRARDPPNTIKIGRSKLDGGEFDPHLWHENFLCPGRAWFLLLPS